MSDDTKYYRLLKDTPAWIKGAILYKYAGNPNYVAMSDMWETEAAAKLSDAYQTVEGARRGGNVGESAIIVENSPEWFERVYPTQDKKKIKYVTKDKAIKDFEVTA